MAQSARRTNGRIGGDWLARDIDSWRVRVPCQGGSGRFRFADYGGSTQKALEAARKFQAKALNLYKKDKAYKAEHGEMPHRDVLPITNRSGILGVCRIVLPRADATPTILWLAYASVNGRRVQKGFSTAQYKTEDVCKRKAVEWRNQQMR